jgi:hypothetical protein
MNIAGETKINHLSYDIENNKVISKDSDNIMTHCLGTDFNSLYPFSMGSILSEQNNYLRKYMLNVIAIMMKMQRRVTFL